MEWQPKVKSAIGAPKMETRVVYKIRIIYKSGATIDFECFKFKVERNAGSTRYVWNSADENVSPIHLGADDIAAVWQVGHREIEVEADQSAD